MSISFLTLICLGTAFTAVSFFFFASKRNTPIATKKEYWRDQGRKLNVSMFSFVSVVIFPVLVLAFVNQSEELIKVLLPTVTISVLTLLQLKRSR